LATTSSPDRPNRADIHYLPTYPSTRHPPALQVLPGHGSTRSARCPRSPGHIPVSSIPNNSGQVSRGNSQRKYPQSQVAWGQHAFHGITASFMRDTALILSLSTDCPPPLSPSGPIVPRLRQRRAHLLRLQRRETTFIRVEHGTQPHPLQAGGLLRPQLSSRRLFGSVDRSRRISAGWRGRKVPGSMGRGFPEE